MVLQVMILVDADNQVRVALKDKTAEAGVRCRYSLAQKTKGGGITLTQHLISREPICSHCLGQMGTACPNRLSVTSSLHGRST